MSRSKTKNVKELITAFQKLQGQFVQNVDSLSISPGARTKPG